MCDEPRSVHNGATAAARRHGFATEDVVRGLEALAAGESYCDVYQPLLDLVRLSARGPAMLPDVSPRLDKWLRRQRKALPRLWDRRLPDLPYSSGPLEQAFDVINHSIRHRRFRFRNLGRLERVLAMMLLNQNQVADERRYAEIIADYLLRHGDDFRALMKPLAALRGSQAERLISARVGQASRAADPSREGARASSAAEPTDRQGPRLLKPDDALDEDRDP